MERAYYISVLKIINTEAIADAGETGQFVFPVTPVKNAKLAIKPILINLLSGSKLMSTHACELDIDGIP